MNVNNKYLGKLDSKHVSSIGIRYVFRQLLKDKTFALRPNLLILLSSDYGATDFVRLVGPAVLNPAYKKTVTICLDHLSYCENNQSFNISNLVLSLFNIFILISREKIDEESFRSLKTLKTKYPKINIITDIDDDLYSIAPSHPEYDHYVNRIKILDELIKLSDTVVVSTNPIKLQVLKRHPSTNIMIIPNYLNNDVWNLMHKEHKTPYNEIRVLYSGTETHDADLRLLEKAIPETSEIIRSKTGMNLKIIVAGGTTLDIKGMEIIQVPDDKRSYPDYVAWIQSMPAFNFAIAPLNLDNAMNRSKSCLKYLEYSAMGLPAIYTDIEPYSEVVIDHMNGILISNNDLDLWKSALIELATNANMREKLAVACKENVTNKLLLSDHQSEWKKVIEK